MQRQHPSAEWGRNSQVAASAAVFSWLEPPVGALSGYTSASLSMMHVASSCTRHTQPAGSEWRPSAAGDRRRSRSGDRQRQATGGAAARQFEARSTRTLGEVRFPLHRKRTVQYESGIPALARLKKWARFYKGGLMLSPRCRRPPLVRHVPRYTLSASLCFTLTAHTYMIHSSPSRHHGVIRRAARARDLG